MFRKLLKRLFACDIAIDDEIVLELFYQKQFVDICRKSFQPRFCSEHLLRKLQKIFLQLIVNYSVILTLSW